MRLRSGSCNHLPIRGLVLGHRADLQGLQLDRLTACILRLDRFDLENGHIISRVLDVDRYRHRSSGGNDHWLASELWCGHAHFVVLWWCTVAYSSGSSQFTGTLSIDARSRVGTSTTVGPSTETASASISSYSSALSTLNPRNPKSSAISA